MKHPARWTLLGVLALTAAAPAATGARSAASDQPRAVIVILKAQHGSGAAGRGQNRSAEAGPLANARAAGAQNLHAYGLIAGFSAQLTAAQQAELAADPAVASIYPDLPIHRPGAAASSAAASSAAPTSPASAPQSGVCPSDPAHPLLEPEALQVTNTAFLDHSTPQAQNIVDGTGVKVAFLADGLDINNPDFIRANGQHVFIDYRDFSGEGPNAPNGASTEAFGDASAVAAQGRQVYDLSNFVHPAHPLPAGCTITIRGVAPGASLIGIKEFGNASTAPTSHFIQAIDYAVSAGADVINESFGLNPFPDTSDDPIALADNAAVAAGVTVVASTGDSGITNTISTPASDPNVIGVAATTTFRSYAQITMGGFQLSNGTWLDDGISAFSSGGITQAARVPDLAAPGDYGWALCTADPALYEHCITPGSQPSPIQLFGGTSQSSPFTAGAAALVIEAYENTHHGVRPAPALVKQLLTSTARDLGFPASEQGAGELDTLAAVQAAESWHDQNGSPAATGNTLVVDQTQLSLVGKPGQGVATTLTVTNASDHTQTITPTSRTLGAPHTIDATLLPLNTATAPVYVDQIGVVRGYATRQISVPAGAGRLDVSAAAPTGDFFLRITLLDPTGALAAYSIPQGTANYAHVDRPAPAAGTWTVIVALNQSSGFNGEINFLASYEQNQPANVVVKPARLTLAAGQSASFNVKAIEADQPGDTSDSLQLASSDGRLLSVPITARTVIKPLPTSFTGVITGGNGRGFPAQSNTYYLDLTNRGKAVSVDVHLSDPGLLVLATLTRPDGQVAALHTNEAEDFSGTTNEIQLYARNLEAGRWVLSIGAFNPVSGLEISQPFSVTIQTSALDVQASLPKSGNKTLAAGVPASFPVQVTNTSPRALSVFADPRLPTAGDVELTDFGGGPPYPLPLPPRVFPVFVVPTETSSFTMTASADQPVNLAAQFQSLEPWRYAAGVNNSATVVVSASQVSAGLWAADAAQAGPFSGPAPSGTVSVTATAHTLLFDPTVTSSTGDAWDNLNGAPVTIDPGQTATITVTITPSGPVGSVRQGTLFIDTFDFFAVTGDEVAALPYAYTISR